MYNVIIISSKFPLKVTSQINDSHDHLIFIRNKKKSWLIQRKVWCSYIYFLLVSTYIQMYMNCTSHLIKIISSLILQHFITSISTKFVYSLFQVDALFLYIILDNVFGEFFHFFIKLKITLQYFLVYDMHAIHTYMDTILIHIRL